MISSAILRRITSRAVGGVIRRVHNHLLDRRFDQRTGFQTGGAMQPWQLTINSENVGFASEYTPTPTRVFRRILGVVNDDLSKFAFIDFGSGKGRMLLLAAELPFVAIEGVEFAAELHETAVGNVANLAAQGFRTEHISCHHMDAAAYAIPDRPCIFYMYNPFGAPVMSRVLDNIEASYNRNPRPMYVLYLNPKLPHLFADRAFLRPVPRASAARLIDRFAFPEPLLVYRTAAA
jgi:hypothetical protein